MANKFLIPAEVETQLRKKHKVCAYCRRKMRAYLGVIGCPKDKATIEHLNHKGPFHWGKGKGLKEIDLVICCQSCNSSRGTKTLPAWFKSVYCAEKKINEKTVSREVKGYLRRKYKN